jgi:hypothetical protein
MGSFSDIRLGNMQQAVPLKKWLPLSVLGILE